MVTVSEKSTCCRVIYAQVQSLTFLGMARIFTCAPGVAKLVMGQEWSSTGLPECFQFTQDRISRLAEGNLPSIW